LAAYIYVRYRFFAVWLKTTKNSLYDRRYIE
jgi:hypothetical protein